MIYLIVPPIIIIFAAAILIIFLARVVPSSGSAKTRKAARPEKKGLFRGNSRKKNGFLRTAGRAASERMRKGSRRDASENVLIAQDPSAQKVTQGIVSDRTKDQVVSLRKKSMVSDKIENIEGRDPVEVSLMEEIEMNPQNSVSYEKLGDYYMEHEQFKDARDCYKYVLRLDPRHKRAQVAMKNLDRVL